MSFAHATEEDVHFICQGEVTFVSGRISSCLMFFFIYLFIYLVTALPRAHRAIQDSPPDYKLLILGDKNTGKTSFIKGELGEKFKENYKQIDGVGRCELIHVSDKPIADMKFDAYNFIGSDIKDTDLSGGDCAILMFDVANWNSYKSIGKKWYPRLQRICGDIPSVLYANKMNDRRRRVVNERDVKFHQNIESMQYIPYSAKRATDIDSPLRRLADALTGPRHMIKVNAVVFFSGSGAGSLHFMQEGNGLTTVTGSLEGLSPGPYGLHIHDTGSMFPEDPFESVLDFMADANGTAKFTHTDSQLPLTGPDSIINKVAEIFSHGQGGLGDVGVCMGTILPKT